MPQSEAGVLVVLGTCLMTIGQSMCESLLG